MSLRRFITASDSFKVMLLTWKGLKLCWNPCSWIECLCRFSVIEGELVTSRLLLYSPSSTQQQNQLKLHFCNSSYSGIIDKTKLWCDTVIRVNYKIFSKLSVAIISSVSVGAQCRKVTSIYLPIFCWSIKVHLYLLLMPLLFGQPLWD